MDPDLVQAVNPGEKIGMRYQQISRADVERKLKGFEKYLPDAN